MLTLPSVLLGLLCLFSLGSASLTPTRHPHSFLIARGKSQPQPNLDTSHPSKAAAHNNATAGQLTVADTKARVAQLNKGGPYWVKQQTAAANGSSSDAQGELFVQVIQGLAALDVQPPSPPNLQATVPANDASVPKAIRPNRNNYTQSAAFAEVAYCLKDYGLRGCGIACASIPKDTKVLFTTGDGQINPLVYVAITPSQKLLTISHQGTNTSSIPSVLNDALFLPFPLTPELTPTPSADNLPVVLSSFGTLAHVGFQATFLRYYPQVLRAVQTALAGPAKGYKIEVVGHSLGASIAQLTAVALKNKLEPKSYKGFRLTTFATPRTGNEFFANYIDKLFGNDQVHFTNQHDPVPHVPPRIALFHSPSNEFYYKDAKTLVYCPGTENKRCLFGAEGNNFTDHLGPFFGIKMNIDNCRYKL